MAIRKISAVAFSSILFSFNAMADFTQLDADQKNPPAASHLS